MRACRGAERPTPRWREAHGRRESTAVGWRLDHALLRGRGLDLKGSRGERYQRECEYRDDDRVLHGRANLGRRASVVRV